MDIPLLKRRIEPKQGCALFFPARKKDERVVVGKPTMIRLWPQEEFKQIQLGDFSIVTVFGPNSPKPSAKTSDNLPCKAQVEFRFRIIEKDEAMEKATRRSSVSKGVKDVITHDSFKTELQGDLETIVEEAIRQYAYLDLLLKPELLGEAEDDIRVRARARAEDKGFELRGCRADVEAVKLDDETLAQQQALKEYRIELEHRKRELENRLKKVELESQLEKDREVSNYTVANDDAIKSRDSEIRERTVKEEEDKLEKKKRSIEIQRTMQELDAMVQREKLEYDHGIEKLKLNLKLNLEKDEKDRRFEREKEELVRQAELAVLKRQEEATERESKLERFRYEIQSAELRVQQAELQRDIAKTESETTAAIGKAEAEVDQEKVLAANSHTMRMNESLLNALPTILEKAYAPAEKLREVKVLYLGGRSATSTGEYPTLTDHALGAVLSSMSTIPMVKEVLRFLSTWEEPLAHGRDQVQEGTPNERRRDEQSTSHPKELESESEAEKG